MVAQFTAKTTNSEKAIHFLTLMSCSINKLKFHTLFTWKNFMFSEFTWKKKNLLQNMHPSLPPPPFLYGAVLNSNITLIFIAEILLKLLLSNLLHPFKLKAPPMVLSNGNVFKISLIPQWTYFPLIRMIRPFSHEKVVIAQSNACRWFYAFNDCL